MARAQPEQQPTNAHHLRVGDCVVTTLQDAYLQGSCELIKGIDESEVRRLHAASHRPTPPRITLNAYVLNTGDRCILVDTGLGALAGDEGARLDTSLAGAGLERADIDAIVITHCHPDHIGGLITAEDDPAFPGRDVLIPGTELDFWDREPRANAGDALHRQFASARRVFGGCHEQIRRLDGTDVMDGITRVPLPGHTPGHSGYRIESRGESLLLAADIVHLPQIQFPRPDAAVSFDVDPVRMAGTRADLFAQVAASGEMIAGHHIDFPGLGHVAADGEGYRFLPHVWAPTV